MSFEWTDWQPILLDIQYPKPGSFSSPPREPITLAAEAIDVDALAITCRDEEGLKSTTSLPLPDTVVIDWRILSEVLSAPPGTPLSGPGASGHLIGAGGRRYHVASGEHALYVPAYVDCAQTLVTQIECAAKNMSTAKYADPAKRAIVTLTIRRDTSQPSQYLVDVDNTQHDDLTSANYTPSTNGEGDCEPEGAWGEATGVVPTQIMGPPNGVICPGERTVLGIGGSNLDHLEMRCKPVTCDGPQTIEVWDTLEYEWSATQGGFDFGNNGSTVTYTAPPTRDVPIAITCTVRDRRHQFPDIEKKVFLNLRTSIYTELNAAIDVIRQCLALEFRWRAAGDLRAQFVRLQVCIAMEVIYRANTGGFQDPCAILRFLTDFIQRFLNAAAGTAVTYDWDVAFTQAARLKADLDAGLGVLWQFLGVLLGGLPNLSLSVFDAETVATSVVTLLMAYAHISTDIRASLKEVGCGSASDFSAVYQLIEHCEATHVPLQVQMAHRVAAAFGLPLANAIKEWRDAAHAEVCECV